MTKPATHRTVGRIRGRAVLGLTAFALAVTIASASRSAEDDFGVGTGADGEYIAGTANEIVNAYTPVIVAAPASATSLVVGSTAAFAAGDIALVLQVKGEDVTSHTTDPPADVNAAAIGVGQYDLVKVTATSATTLTVTPPLTNAFDESGAQVVRVPQFTTVGIVDGASITAKAWDGVTGGVVAILARDAITGSRSGTIHANGRGFRGGNRSNPFCLAPCNTGNAGSGPIDETTGNTGGKGESFDPRAEAFGPSGCGIGARASGGGGGGHINAGGGGGGNAGPGGRGGNGWNSGAPFGGYPGAGLGARLIDRLTFGGGGGGGQQDNGPARASASTVSRGGAGGGIVWARTRELIVPAAITANGSNGSNAASDGAGGAGAGGSVLVRTVDYASCTLRANGGNGGTSAGHGPGGGGGPGRVRVELRSGTCATEAEAGNRGAGGLGTVKDPGDPSTSPVEDAGGALFGCVDGSICPNEKPVCDPVARACRKCATNADCTVGTCAPSGACVVTPDAGPDAGDAGDGGDATVPDAGRDANGPIDGDDGAGTSADEELGGGGCTCSESPTGGSRGAWGGLVGLVALAIGWRASGRRRRRRDD